MAQQHSSLGYIQYVPPSPGAVYVNGSGTRAYIRGLYFFNANQAAVETVKAYAVPMMGGTVATAGTQNQFFSFNLQPNQGVSLELPGPGLILMTQYDSIQASTTTAAHVTCLIFGDYDC
jgi:hypothetical protein